MRPNGSSRDGEASRIASRIRLIGARQVLVTGGGYLGQICSSAEILATLFARVLRIGPSMGPGSPPSFSGVPGQTGAGLNGSRYLGKKAPHLDRFVLSPAHYAMALYATLIASGRLSADALEDFNRDGSTLEMIGAEHSPGCELTTGSFGQALSQAAGIALARRHRGETGRVWVMLSDGECQEGQTWEALQFSSFHRIANLSVIVDLNGQQVDGRIADVMAIEPLQEKIAAFGAHVRRIDGHDPTAIAAACDSVADDRPLVVLADTNPTRGLPSLEARWPRLHYVRLSSEEERAALRSDVESLQGSIDRMDVATRVGATDA